MRRAKIVATLGPALDDRATLRAAIEAGIDVVRLNFSYGDHAAHARRLEAVRELTARLGRTVGSLADLQGPKIRLGVCPPEGVAVSTGSEVFLVPGRERLDEYSSDGIATLPVPYPALATDVVPGALVLIDDGSIRLICTRVEPDGVWARVVVGGVARSRKGVNLPGVNVSAPSLTPKDLEDLRFALDLGVDWVALSFVRTPADVIKVRERVRALGSERPIVAKLERSEPIENLTEVVAASDGVMVARGDLGVEIGPEQVPAIQKEIIRQANAAARPVITATEMLESMISSARATRAEASDVANAVFDGTDALMLSGETAVGRYPVEAVRTMAQIIEVAERSPHLVHPSPPPRSGVGVSRVVAQAACAVARDLRAAAIVVYTISGSSAQLASTCRPPMPILALTPRDETRLRAALMWGTYAAFVPMQSRYAELLTAAERMLIDGGWAVHGDRVVIVTGRPGGLGGTNRIIVHRIGDEIVI